MMTPPSWIRLIAVILTCVHLTGRCNADIRNLFSFGRNNNKDGRITGAQQRQQQNQRGPRRRLLEDSGFDSTGAVGRADVHIDAATGTVPHLISAEERAREATAQSCDGQMAAALVRANQLATVAEQDRDVAVAKLAAAVDLVANADKRIAHLETALEEEKAAHEQDLQDAAKALQESKESATQILQETKDRAQTALRDTEETAQQKIEASKEEFLKLLNMQKEGAQAELEVLRTEKDEIINSLEAKLKMTSDDLQRKLQEELEKARADRDTKLTDLKAKMEAAVANVESDRDEKLAALQDKLDRSDSKVSMLEAKIQAAADDAARVLQTTKEEAKAYMLNQVSAVKDELALTKKEHEKTLDAKNEKIKNLEDYTKKVMEKKSATEHALEEAMADLYHWRSLHMNRTYCNMTHIRADLYSASVDAYHHSLVVGRQVYSESQKYTGHAKQQIQKGIEFASQVYKEQLDKHWPIVKPHFDEHVIGNYRQHVEPHMQKYVLPKLKQLSTWYQHEFKPQAVKFSKGCEEQYARLIILYGQQCNASIKEFRKASRNSDFLKKYPPPASLMKMWGDSCSHPQESVELAFQGLLLLLGFMFYRTLFGLVAWMLSWAVALILILTPMGLIISRRELFSKHKASQSRKVLANENSKKREQRQMPDNAPSSNGVATRNRKNGAAPKKNSA